MNTNKMLRELGFLMVTGAVLTAGAVSGLAQSVLAYDNSAFASDLQLRFTAGAVEYGDQIILKDPLPSYNVTEFGFEYFLIKGLDAGSSASAQIRFYANNGPLFNGYATPGAVPLWDSGVFPIAGTQRNTLVFDSTDFGALIVPKEFTWTVQFSGIPVGELAGLDIYSPPTVGQNYPDLWYNNAGTWELREYPNQDPPASFGARLYVVPEPSTVAFGLALGAGAIFFVRAHRRQTA